MTSAYLDPIAAAERISSHYARYLRTTFQVGDADLRDDVQRALETAVGLSKGPFLQVVPPFTVGVTVRDLIEEGLLHPALADLREDALPIDRPLYAHQERALRLAVGVNRNLLIATGTGSGKTETFLLPIIDFLLRERAAGTLGPGVRALLLYPMNVLANDQMRRIRALLAPYPQLTFGRYIGATAKTRDQAHALFRQHSPGETILENELMSRAEMQETPPNILLTNFSMLEYLLLRTTDLRLFANDPSTWRFVVLDEVHTYSGAKGTEIASLMRRVKQRVLPPEKQKGTLHCMGTSATLGSEKDSAELVRFASDLFGEEFEWVEAEDGKQDVVTPTRDAGRLGEASNELKENAYGQLLDLVLRHVPAAELAEAASLCCGGTVDATLSVPAQLAAVLTADRRFLDIREKMVAEEVAEPSALVARFFPETGNAGLVSLVALGTRARHHPADAALLPARFHYLVRSLDGVYGCLHPAHPAGQVRVRLEPHLTCPACEELERDVSLFEIAACEACGAAYLAGVPFPSDGTTYLRTTTPSNPAREWYLLDASAETEGDEDEDEALSDGVALSLLPNQAERWLCVGCGAVRDNAEECSCKAPALRRVLLVKGNDDGVITQCASCRRRNTAGVVRRLAAGAGGPLSVIASDLYQSLPAVLTGANFIPGEGRKLISFSDSRQQAAEFAVFLDRTYGRAIERNLILLALQGLRDSLGDESVSFATLRAAVAKRAAKEGAIDSADPRDAERAAAQWIIREAVTGNQRLSLEGTGLLDVSVRVSLPTVPQPLLDLGLDANEVRWLLQELITTLRYAGALTLPAGLGAGEVDIPGSFVTFRGEGATKGVRAWLPAGTRRNSRIDYLRRVIVRLGCDVDARPLLTGIWQLLNDPRHPVLSAEQSKRDGVVSSIPFAALEFGIGQAAPTWKCDRCRRITHRSVRGVCPTYGCPGTLQSVPSVFDGHYAQLYSELAPIPACIEEHTAQIEAYEATKIQNAFQEGTVNILSCSTTFELGVDVGEVQAVLMRNVPPSPANYVQRAGRAGRRADSTALVVTFAQRRNHDRYYFENPLPMLKGVVQPPIMTLTNQTILRRHVQSVAFAMFEHTFGRTDASVIDFFGVPGGEAGEEPAYAVFRRWLEDEPDALRTALKTMLADMPGMTEALGLDNWAWVDRLLSGDTEHLDRAWLTRAYDEFCEMDGKLEELIKEAGAERAFGRANHLQKIQDTIRKRDLLGYMATYGVLPKYGFPSDVVEMRVQSEESAGDVDARRIELSRDLQIAVAEYAPGAQVVAGKQRWESIGLGTRRDRALLVFNWMTCPTCEAYDESAEEVEEGFPTCRSCGERIPSSKRGVFVIPSFGFIGRHVSSHIESPRAQSGFAEFHFAHYQGQQPEVRTVTLGSKGPPLEVLASPSGKIAVLNRGKKAQGFQVCRQCGYARPASRKVGNAKGHEVPGRKSVKCKGMLRNMALGHRFITDVLEIRPSVAMPRSAALSVLQALVTGAVVLGIPDNDIGGVLRPLDSGRYGLVLYDTVPGGAGHVTSIAKRLDELFAAALRRVVGCNCGIETSCYGCLRSYRNERVHDDLSRQQAIQYLETLLGTQPSSIQ